MSRSRRTERPYTIRTSLHDTEQVTPRGKTALFRHGLMKRQKQHTRPLSQHQREYPLPCLLVSGTGIIFSNLEKQNTQ